MVLGASGDTNGDSWTVTISWQRINGTWAQSQVVVTDEIHDPYVHMERPRLKTFFTSAQNDITMANAFTA